MIKVFLVEDEIVIRQSIRKNIDWQEAGLEFVGEARDGELAYPVIQQLKPDIIITDIKMPFMDGLELSKLVRSEMPSIKIIILSGYDEFEYARKAVSIGVTDYLLKPISASELLKAITKVKEVIEEEQIKKEYMERFLIESSQNESVKRQNFFNDLVSNRFMASESIQKGRELQIDLSAQNYNIVIIQLESKEHELRSFSEVITSAKQEIRSNLEKSRIISFDRMDESIAFLVLGKDSSEIDSMIQVIIDTTRNGALSYQTLEYFIGVGMEVQRLSELAKCYSEACKAFSYRYILDSNQIVYSKDLNDYHLVNYSNMEPIDVNIKNIDMNIIDKFLKSGIKSEITTFLKEYLFQIGEKNMESLMFRQFIVMSIYFKATNLLLEWGYSKDYMAQSCGEISMIVKNISNLSDSTYFLEKVLNCVIEVRDLISTKKNKILIEQAKQYMRENYSKEDISLNVVANYINISPSYFSAIFSQESGQTFVEYLTKVRMNKAKELLRCTNMKSSEIGYAVGYKDPHYFSYLFKKTQNCNPKEFRLQG